MSLSFQERPLASHPSSYEPNLAEDCLPLTFTHHSECYNQYLSTLYRLSVKTLLSLSHIWATRTITLSYTQISLVQVRTSLLAFPRFVAGANRLPNLDSAFSYQDCFLLRKRQDCVFECDYVSTSFRRNENSFV